jgi:glycosyltransferase involved in cell wall biosynthesis
MITVTILTKNAEKTIFSTLQSVAEFDEIILLDTGSTDQTLEIAKTFPNVCIHQSRFIGFGPLHNLAAKLAKHDWILSLDSDEILTPSLKEEILLTSLHPSAVYSLPFHNYFNGKFIKWCGWYPERHVRLYNRRATSFSTDEVHEGVVTQNLTVKLLKHPVKHCPYRSISDFLRKMDFYSDLFAHQYCGKKKSSIQKALLHGIYAFIRSYVLKRGFLGGKEGLLISIYNSQTTFYKYVKLWKQNAAHSSLPSNRKQ